MAVIVRVRINSREEDLTICEGVDGGAGGGAEVDTDVEIAGLGELRGHAVHVLPELVPLADGGVAVHVSRVGDASAKVQHVQAVRAALAARHGREVASPVAEVRHAEGGDGRGGVVRAVAALQVRDHLGLRCCGHAGAGGLHVRAERAQAAPQHVAGDPHIRVTVSDTLMGVTLATLRRPCRGRLVGRQVGSGQHW